LPRAGAPVTNTARSAMVDYGVSPTTHIVISRITQFVVVPLIEYVEVPVVRLVEVEKIVEVPVEKIVEVQIPIEKLVEVPVERVVRVEVEKLVEVPTEKIVEVEKVVTVEKLVEKFVEVEKIVEVVKYVEVDGQGNLSERAGEPLVGAVGVLDQPFLAGSSEPPRSASPRRKSSQRARRRRVLLVAERGPEDSVRLPGGDGPWPLKDDLTYLAALPCEKAEPEVSAIETPPGEKRACGQCGVQKAYSDDRYQIEHDLGFSKCQWQARHKRAPVCRECIGAKRYDWRYSWQSWK